jgi:hypothetical protein
MEWSPPNGEVSDEVRSRTGILLLSLSLSFFILFIFLFRCSRNPVWLMFTQVYKSLDSKEKLEQFLKDYGDAFTKFMADEVINPCFHYFLGLYKKIFIIMIRSID